MSASGRLPGRLRENAHLRRALGMGSWEPRQVVVPVFVTRGSGKTEIAGLPGIYRYGVAEALAFLKAREQEGFANFIAFGVEESGMKTPDASLAWDASGPVCELMRRAKAERLAMAAWADVCLCQYTSHGHCGVLEDSEALKLEPAGTLAALSRAAVAYAAAGADVVAPSACADGQVAAIRAGLDAGGLWHTAICSYSVKYASGFYGPFREAAGSAPSKGDRRGYQMDPARGVAEALAEVRQDEAEGADMVMVKPAGPYLDVLAAVKREAGVPVVAYQVSGEYAMLRAAAEAGMLDFDRCAAESLLAIKRAGADLVITYLAEWMGG